MNGLWLKQLCAGMLIGTSMIMAICLIIWTIGGFELQLDTQRSLQNLMFGLYIFLFAALLEETLFRGFIFQRLLNGLGVWPTQLGLAILFAYGHWGNPGLDGTTQVVATIDLALVAIVFGLAFIRTGSLALPLGLHLGWNWSQGSLLGFGVSGFENTGWFQPVFQGQAEWLTGGDFGPEASVFAVLINVIFIVALYKWKGTKKSGTC